MLSTRELNRALLARQLLLERKRLKPLDTVERLVGMQAQVPRDPYVGLWSRLEGFRAASLSSAIDRRDAVRMPFLRATLHLVSRRDALALRPLVDAVADRSLHSQSPFGRAIEGVDVRELTSFASALLAEQPGRVPSSGRCWPSGGPNTTPRPSRTHAPICCTSSRSRRVGCGNDAGRLHSRRWKRGSASGPAATSHRMASCFGI